MTRTETQLTRQVDPSSCQGEPIHIPGSIQPHGVLLVLDQPSFVVRQASRNVDEMLGLGLDDLLGRSLDEIFGPLQADELRKGMGRLAPERRSLLLLSVKVDVEGKRGTFQAIARRNGDVLILELEEYRDDRQGSEKASPIHGFGGFLACAPSPSCMSKIVRSTPA